MHPKLPGFCQDSGNKMAALVIVSFIRLKPASMHRTKNIKIKREALDLRSNRILCASFREN